ncbi:MAG: poly-gamma-glutamate system protein [Acidobacteriota bacterium]
MDFHWLTPRSNKVLVPVTVLVLLAAFWVESGKEVVPSPWYEDMLRAAQLSATAARAIKDHRLERGVFVDAINDPAETAMIGQEFTQITTDRGYLDAKLASTDPNFAAVAVDLFRQIELEEGDCVALATTGSFPALNLSTIAALEVLGIEAVTISSVGASNYGATDPFFTWLDMERVVHERGIFSTRSMAASIGGDNDTGRGLAPKGRELLAQAIRRNDITMIATEQLEGSIQERVRMFREGCAPRDVSAYINVGGGIASLGHPLNADLIPVGASLRLPDRNYPARGTLLRFAADGVPVVQLRNVRQLRDRYGLDSVADAVPAPGRGDVFGQVRYDLPRAYLATFGILSILISLFTWDRRIHRLGQLGPEDEKREDS